MAQAAHGLDLSWPVGSYLADFASGLTINNGWCSSEQK
jgi:hypothetical protein